MYAERTITEIEWLEPIFAVQTTEPERASAANRTLLQSVARHQIAVLNRSVLIWKTSPQMQFRSLERSSVTSQ
jgi:hypothetical protein